MTKSLFFLLFITLFAITALWFVENDGSVVVEWIGYRVQTSVAFAILFAIVAIVACTLLLQIVLWIKSAPKRYRKERKEKRLRLGLSALTQGFAAIAAGDIKRARSLSGKASDKLDNMPITKLLAAQTAQLAGNRESVKEHYTSMMGDKETEIIAIKGLLVEAKQDNDIGKEVFLAEKAYSLRPDADWVILVLLDLYQRSRQWPKAEIMIHKALKRKLITNPVALRSLGLIAFAKYQKYKESENSRERDVVIKTAYKLIPNFIPVVVAYTEMLVRRRKMRKATKILENMWSTSMHPDIATAYIDIYNDDEKRLERAEKLLDLSHGHPEGHIVVAAVALSTEQFRQARHHLNIALGFGETRMICNMMAELESMERSKHEVVRYWRERAMVANDISIWKCRNCCATSHTWEVNCHNCSAFDSMEWRDIQNVTNLKN